MGDPAAHERLQPALLDRLTDDEPRKQVESRDKRVLSLQKFREGVLRDLTWLLNTGRLSDTEDLTDFPEVARSVLNYGVPDMTGRTASGADVGALERTLVSTIREFEPRLVADTVRVRALVAGDEMSPNTLAFEIDAELWADPVPLQLYLRTEFDLESGLARVVESRGPDGD